MSAKFCCTCIHWEKDIITRIGEKFGICHEVIAPTKIIQDNDTKINETNDVLYTESYFGCIYWRENDGSIINFRDVIDEETGEILDDE